MKNLVEGWLKLYRSIQNHWLWEDKPFSRGQAFVDLLLMANHKDNKILFNGELIEVKRGSEGEEEAFPPTSPLFYPSPIHELLANSDSLSPVSYKTFFENADIREEDGAIKIKAENEFSKGAIQKYIKTLELEINKKIEVV